MNTWPHNRSVWLPTLLMAACAWPVHAQDKGFQFSASYQLQHDSNLFRLPDWADPQLYVGQPTTADTLQIKSVGVTFDQTYSLQNIRAQVSLVDYDYSRNSRYDLTAENYDLNWDWAFTPRLRGRLHGDRTETVNSFDDGSTLTSGANRRVRINHGADFRFELDGRWKLLGGLYQYEDKYDEAVVGSDSYRQTTIDGGLQRSFGSGSVLTGKLRRSWGRNISSSASASSSYRQNDLQMDMRWALSGVTTANAGIRYADRNHPSAPAFDYNGFNGSASINWQPSGKLLFSFSGSSELSSYQSSTSTHARTNRVGVSALWMISPFTSLRASVNDSRLQLLGHPAGGTTNPRRDHSMDTSLNASWTIDDHFTLNGGLVYRQRNSNQSFYDFSSTLYSVGLSAAF